MNVAAYRSWEGFGDVRWGMTYEEVAARLSDAPFREADQLTHFELVDDRPAAVRYLFREGHLARVIVAYAPEAAAAAEFVRADLSRKFGTPVVWHPSRFRRGPYARVSRSEAEGLLALGLLVTGFALAVSGHSNGSWGGDYRRPPSQPAPDPPPAPQRPMVHVDLASRSTLPVDELAYAKWLSRDSTIEWIAHESTPEVLLTSFGSRRLLER